MLVETAHGEAESGTQTLLTGQCAFCCLRQLPKDGIFRRNFEGPDLDLSAKESFRAVKGATQCCMASRQYIFLNPTGGAFPSKIRIMGLARMDSKILVNSVDIA